MDYEKLKETLKRIEFKRTEPEVLVRLIEKANEKGEKARNEFRRLSDLVDKISRRVSEMGILSTKTCEDHSTTIVSAIGVDGSNQLIESFGGKWYVFLSVAGIIFENGISSQPKVDIFWADIEEFDESNEPNIKKEAEIKMLSIESRLILEYSDKPKSVIFIDGPIVDPPFKFSKQDEYIELRCNAIKKALNNDILIIGCVKRIRDRFFINFLKKDVQEVEEFPTDQHLMLMLFTKFRIQNNITGPLYTKWIDSTEINRKNPNLPYKNYEENGVHVISLFFEKNINSKILRVDVPLNFSPSENPERVDDIVGRVVKTVDYWSYPSQDPLPIYLAHEKCNIRKGAAEILYEEIITKSRSLDIYNQIISSRMR